MHVICCPCCVLRLYRHEHFACVKRALPCVISCHCPWQAVAKAPAATKAPSSLPELAHTLDFVKRPVEAVEVSVSLAEPSAVPSSSHERLSVEVSGDQVYTLGQLAL